MKKFLISSILIIILLFSIFSFKENENDIPVMGDVRVYKIKDGEYMLNFEDEGLTLSNLKLKLAVFTSYKSIIKRIYINYTNNSKEYFNNKEYFSFNNEDINEGISKIKEEYIRILEENNAYNLIENLSESNISINKVLVQTELEALDKFKNKYPNVKVMPFTE